MDHDSTAVPRKTLAPIKLSRFRCMEHTRFRPHECNRWHAASLPLDHTIEPPTWIRWRTPNKQLIPRKLEQLGLGTFASLQ